MLDIFHILALHSVFRQKRPTSTCVLATLLVASVLSLALKSKRMKEKKKTKLKLGQQYSLYFLLIVPFGIYALIEDK